MVGMAEMGAPISLDGWQSIQIVVVSACVIFILHQKSQNPGELHSKWVFAFVTYVSQYFVVCDS